jgi:hypothetical protein
MKTAINSDDPSNRSTDYDGSREEHTAWAELSAESIESHAHTREQASNNRLLTVELAPEFRSLVDSGIRYLVHFEGDYEEWSTMLVGILCLANLRENF